MAIGVPSTTPSDTSLGRAWLIAVTLFSLNVMAVMDRHVMAVLLPEIKAEFQIGDFELSLLNGLAFVLFYSALGVYFGGLIDRRPRRSIIYFGVTLWSLAAMGTGLALNYVQMFVARMLVGVGESTISPATQSLLVDVFPPRRLMTAMATVMAASSTGAALAFALGGWLLDHLTLHPLFDMSAWRQVLLLTGAPGMFLALLVFTFSEPRRRGVRKEQPDISAKDFARMVIDDRRVIVNLLLGYGCGAIVALSSQSWGPTYARRVLGISASHLGSIMGLIFGIGGLVSIMATGLLADWLISRGVKDAAIRIFIVALAIAAPVNVIAFLSNNVTLFYTAVAVTHFSMAGAFAPGMACLQLVSNPRSRGRIAALFLLTTTLLSVAVGPMVTGFLTDYVYVAPERIGWSIATVAAAFGSLSILLLLRARRPFMDRMALQMAAPSVSPLRTPSRGA